MMIDDNERDDEYESSDDNEINDNYGSNDDYNSNDDHDSKIMDTDCESYYESIMEVMMILHN